jgi:hypothetical protein
MGCHISKEKFTYKYMIFGFCEILCINQRSYFKLAQVLELAVLQYTNFTTNEQWLGVINNKNDFSKFQITEFNSNVLF